MAEASTIGAIRQYTGNAALGGGGLGAVKIDTQPIEDFAKYVMLYNKAEWDQRQKDLEKDAAELADFASLDLSTTIPKHAKIAQQKYDDLYTWVSQNPDALSYRTEDGKVNTKFIEYKKRKADLMNDISFIKKNSILNEARKKQIADEPNEDIKKFLQSKLDAEIEAKDIRETLDHSPKFDLTLPDWGQNKGQSLDVMVRGLNDNTFKQSTVFDITEGKRLATAYGIGLAGIDQNSETGQQQQMLLQRNPLVQGANIFNSVVANAMQGIDQNKTPAEQDEELKKKLSNLGIMKSVNQFNDYMADMRAAIKEKRFSDEFGRRLDPADYTDINFKDGISPEELSLLAQFAGWEGDKTALRQAQTNNDIEMRRLALGWANYGIDKQRLDESSSTQILGAQSVLAQIQQAIKTGTQRQPLTTVTTVTRDKKGNIIGQPQKSSTAAGEQVLEIRDADLLKNYATIENGSTPDAFFYNPKKKTMDIIYYKKDDEGGTLMQDGAPVIDTGKTTPTSVDNWITNIVGRKFAGDDKGKVNNLVSEIMRTGFDYDLIKFADVYGTAPDKNKVVTEEKKRTTSSSSGINWK